MNVQPMSMPSTILSLTLRSTDFRLSFRLCWWAVVVKARGMWVVAARGATRGSVLAIEDIVAVIALAERAKGKIVYEMKS